MKSFSEWMKLQEAKAASPGKAGGTQRPKPDRNFVSNTSQYWGPSATFGHEPRKVQTAAEKLVSAPIAAIGQSFKDSLGRDPGQVPTFAWQGIRQQFTDRHVILDITLPLQLVAIKNKNCFPGCEPNCDCQIDWEFHDQFKQMGERESAMRHHLKLSQKFKENSKQYVVVSPRLDDVNEREAAIAFTRAMIQRDMYETLQKNGQLDNVDFYDAKWEPKINPEGPEPTMTIIGMFPRIGADIAQQRAQAIAER